MVILEARVALVAEQEAQGGPGGALNGTNGGTGGNPNVNGTNGVNGGGGGASSGNGGAGGLGNNGGGNGGSGGAAGAGGGGGGGIDLNNGAGTGGGGGGGSVGAVNSGGGGGGGGGVGVYVASGNILSNVGGAGGAGGIGNGGGGGGGGGGSAAVLTNNAIYQSNVGDTNVGGQGGNASRGGLGGSTGASGGGGAGGHGIFMLAQGNLVNRGSNTGGRGGDADAGFTALTNGQAGKGGSGIVLKVNGTLDNLGVNIGGQGGQGGIRNGGSEGGGAGGHGIFLMAGGTVTQSGTSSGGQGGQGGLGVNAGAAGAGGVGGNGIFATDADITNAGNFNGGAGGNGGSNGNTGAAGAGGVGGNGILATNADITNTGNLNGGAGGIGGGNTGIGGAGAGGVGGNGILATDTDITNTGSLNGGAGGNGGVNGGALNAGGNGGLGGHGAQLTGGNFINSGSITAGNGGNGSNATGGIHNGTNGGQGGDGINASNANIINAGTVTRGLGGAPGLPSGGGSNGSPGADGVAIRFIGGTNRLEIQQGSTITGNVLAFSNNDTFALGGTSNSSFDLSQIGPSQQYQNFGAFEKTGSSLWTVTNMSSQLTNWVIKQGTLAVEGIINGTMLVESAGRLQGTGSMNTTTVNGVIAPGNSIGILNIFGSFLQNPGSVYEVEINPLGQSDLISITGGAVINGGIVNVIKEIGNYFPGTRYTILTAAGGVSGIYSVLTQNLPFLDLALSYDSNHVYLDIVRRVIPIPNPVTNSFINTVIRFAFFGITPNQIFTANAIESLNPLDPVFLAVLNSPNERFAQLAFDQLSGEIHAATLGVFFEESRYVRDAVFNRLQQAFANGSLMVLDEKFGFQQAIKSNSGFALWADGFGSWGNLQGNFNSAKVNRSTGGVFLGGDTDFGEALRVGVLGGYSNSDFKLNARLSHGTSDNYHLGTYAGAKWNHWGLRVAGVYAWHDVHTSRHVLFPGFNNFLTAKYQARTTQAFAETGYDIAVRRLNLEPFAGAAYVNVGNDFWREFGGPAALLGNKQHQDVVYFSLGVKESAELYQGEHFSLNEKIALSWRHTYGSINPKAISRFFNGSIPLLITAAPIGRNNFLVDAGLNWANSSKNLNLRLAYIGQWSKSINDNGIAGLVSWRFS